MNDIAIRVHRSASRLITLLIVIGLLPIVAKADGGVKPYRQEHGVDENGRWTGTLKAYHATAAPLLEDGFEGDPWNDKWNADAWFLASDCQMSGDHSATADGTRDDAFYSQPLAAAVSGLGVDVDLWFRTETNQAEEDLQLSYHDGSGFHRPGTLVSHLTWSRFTELVTHEDGCLTDQFRLYFDFAGNGLGDGEQVWIDDVRVTPVEREVELYAASAGQAVDLQTWYDQDGSGAIAHAAEIAWLLSHHHPLADAPVGLTDPEQARCVQEAVWHLADGFPISGCGADLADDARAAVASPPPVPASLTLSPSQDTYPVDQAHSLTATLLDQSDGPIAGRAVVFSVSGANSGASGTCAPAGCTTDAAGQVDFTYTPETPGADTITAQVSHVEPGILAWQRGDPPQVLVMGDPQLHAVSATAENTVRSTAVTVQVLAATLEPDARRALLLGAAAAALTALTIALALRRRWSPGTD